MFQLKQIAYKDIEKYDVDYCRRSGDLEVPEGCAYYGIYRDSTLVSYFGVQDGSNDGIFIRRGYVLPQFRSEQIWKVSLALLEQAAKEQGFKNLEFFSERNPLAYKRKFESIGFKMKYAGFIKQIGD